MTKNSVLKGVFFVGIGASSYGMLATFVKIAYSEGFTTPEVAIAQLLIGIIVLLIINAFQKAKKGKEVIKASAKNIFSLITAGSSIGFTSVFYYMSLHYIPVSIAIILLMQTVWMGVVFEMFLEKKKPSLQKVIAATIVLAGTVLATNLMDSSISLNWMGIFFGLLSAVTFTATMITANRVALGISSTQRSLYMLIGGFLVVLSFAFFAQTTPFNFDIFLKWGIVLALFGTIIPPLLFNIGFPLTGIGLGSIVSALELPVSVLMAYFILNEKVNATQWLGIVLIILAIFIMNIDFKHFLKK
ncbi:MAG TPA: DMT family transporter [Flavobacterium sp.]